MHFIQSYFWYIPDTVNKFFSMKLHPCAFWPFDATFWRRFQLPYAWGYSKAWSHDIPFTFEVRTRRLLLSVDTPIGELLTISPIKRLFCQVLWSFWTEFPSNRGNCLLKLIQRKQFFSGSQLFEAVCTCNVLVFCFLK